MISGAARAEAAVLVIDAKEGVRENSRRHGYILSMLGIRQVVVCVNKMDLVELRRGPLPRHRERVPRVPRGASARLSPRHFIPVAAVDGREPGHAQPSRRPGTTGRRCSEALDGCPRRRRKTDQPLRMPVQAVYKFTEHGDDRRIFAGRIEAGQGRGRRQGGVLAVEQDLAPSRASRASTPRRAPASTPAGRPGFTLTEEIYVTRGEVMSHVEQAAAGVDAPARRT